MKKILLSVLGFIKRIIPFLIVFITLALVVLIAYFGFFLVIKMKNALFSLPPELSTTIIAGVATVLVSVLSVILSKNYERKMLVENDIREQKTSIYEEFIKFSFDIFLAHKDEELKDKKKQKEKEKQREKQMQEYFSNFTYKLIVWGSDDVIKEWADFKQNTIQKKYKSSLEMMLGFEKTLLVIRKDIGHGNKGLKPGSLLELFINDLHEIKKD